MQVENPKLRSFLDNCLYTLYMLDSYKYLNYTICYFPNADYTYAGVYHPDIAELVIIDHDFYNKELLFCTALHELAHHVQYVNEGETKHDASFKKIHEDLLFAAFTCNEINPSKLLLSELYLSSYKESNRIVTLCNQYINTNATTLFNLEIRNDEPQRYKKDYQYNPLIQKYYRFIKSTTKKWYPHLIEK